jgi:DNA gyrase subunit A
LEDESTFGKRIPINIEDEMRKSYMEYAMSVIVGRALPDVRDGLKPVHRRSLFAMYGQRNFHNSAYKKSARIVGDVIGKYHPHGDTAVYDTIVRMAQNFSMRYLLVDGQGNFGSVDGDSAAAMRYTEIRLTSIAGELLKDLDKDTVDFRPNYDGSEQEPTVLPAPYPNLLVNGSSGIAVGMATNIPPHNLREVIDGCVALINDPSLGNEDLMEYIQGPDFPTAGTIFGKKGIVDAYTTGRGKVRVRAKAHFESRSGTGDDDTIIVTELPYQVNKARLLAHIATLVKDKKVEGIRDLRDESDRTGMRMVIECRRDAMPTVVLNHLYKSTALQTTFGVMNLAIVQGRPRILTLREMLQLFIDHRRDVVTRRCLFELREKERREHILEGYVIALDNIDEIVRLIKESNSPPEAKATLMARFALSDIQAGEILQMRLARLTGLERDKIHEELVEVRKAIAYLQSILADERKLLDVIIDEMTMIREKYGDDRRTNIVPFDGDLSEEDLIANDEVVVTISKSGYIKRTMLTEYQAQKRGGRGKIGATTKDEDFVVDMFSATNHASLLVFTSFGKVYSIKVWGVPEGGRYARGKPIVNLISIEKGEVIRAVLPVTEFTEGAYLIFATKKGQIKKTDLMAYSRPRAAGLAAIDIVEGDQLVDVRMLQKEDVMLTTKSGLAIRFVHTDTRAMGRKTRGVRGIRLRGDDEVVSMQLIRPGLDILAVTEHGYGKRSPEDQYRITKRGGKGIVTILTTERNGYVVGAKQVEEDDQAMIVTDGGMMIRFRVTDVRSLNRYTQGVRLVRLRENEKVVGLERLVDVEDDDEEVAALETDDEAVVEEIPEGLEDDDGDDDESGSEEE